ncbi:N-6 DNA methylase [Treponema sp. UBA7567]|uniref:N-6 DNA methylase n=1 Tax=Treponema sp. UBA7567 TaxID=1947748 RepID=UPI0039C990A4
MTVEKLGIVYTPVPVVDFIIHSVEWVLNKEFGRSLSDEKVNIIDPFTGTGTFITRLLQSGIIKKEDLARKYRHEIFANEIVLLAYYIASVNIENAYHDLIKDCHSELDSEPEYEPFSGICLTDTFQLYENGDPTLDDKVFSENSDRVNEQKKQPITVVMGNPPYSVGQKSANDNAQNQSYEKLEDRIAETYVKESEAGLNKSAYDSYIKAFRWASDRIAIQKNGGGIIAFVSNGSYLDGNAQDGFRKTLEKEFDKIYVFNLRGNQRTSGELSRREGGKIFGSGSRTPIAITVLVKKETA